MRNSNWLHNSTANVKVSQNTWAENTRKKGHNSDENNIGILQPHATKARKQNLYSEKATTEKCKIFSKESSQLKLIDMNCFGFFIG